MNNLIKKLGCHLFRLTVATAIACSAGNAASMNPNTIILPNAADPHTSSVPIGTVLPDGSTYLGNASGTNLTGTWDWCYSGAPTDYYNGCAVAGYPTGVRLAGQTISVTGTDLKGHQNTTELYGACYPFSENLQPWTTTLRLDTTVFKSGSKIVLTFDQDGYQALGGVPIGNVYGVSSESWSWTVYNSFFAGGNKEFDKDMKGSYPDSQKSLLDTLAGYMSTLGYQPLDNVDAVGLSLLVSDMSKGITNATAFYMSSHGQLNELGDSVAQDSTGDSANYLDPNPDNPHLPNTGAAAAVADKGQTIPATPQLNFVYCDACLTMDNVGSVQNPYNEMADALLNGATDQSQPLTAASLPDRVAMGWPVTIGSFNDVRFAKSLFMYLDRGYTLHQSIKDSAMKYPIYANSDSLQWNKFLNRKPVMPQIYGDVWMTLHGVYGGDPSNRYPGAPLSWYNFATGDAYLSQVTTTSCSTAGLQ